MMPEQVVATPAQATPAEPVAAPAAPVQKVSANFQILARKEKALVQQQRAYKEEMAKFQQERDAYQRERQERDQKYDLASKDPLKALEIFGHDYKKATERMLNNGEVTPQDVQRDLMDKISQLEKKMSERDEMQEKKQQELSQQQEVEVIQSFKEDLVKLAQAKANDYKLVGLLDPECALVYDTIETDYELRTEGMSEEESARVEPMHPSVAMKKVEAYLKGLVDKANGVIAPAKIAPKQGNGTSPTLTHEINSSAPSLLPAATEQDRLRRAMAALG